MTDDQLTKVALELADVYGTTAGRTGLGTLLGGAGGGLYGYLTGDKEKAKRDALTWALLGGGGALASSVVPQALRTAREASQEGAPPAGPGGTSVARAVHGLGSSITPGSVIGAGVGGTAGYLSADMARNNEVIRAARTLRGDEAEGIHKALGLRSNTPDVEAASDRLADTPQVKALRNSYAEAHV